jgi:protein-S-isoprenylcysteine O-methyltransferase Ste14
MVAVVLVLGILFWLRSRNGPRLPNEVMLLVVAAIFPVVMLDVTILGVHRRPSTGLEWDKPFTPNPHRILTKLVGLLATLVPFAFAYWAFPEYSPSGFYAPFYDLLRRFAPMLVLAAGFYFTMMDGHMAEPEDTYWQIGRFVMGHPEDLKKDLVPGHFRGWLVKAYFFPLMFVWLSGSTRNVVSFDLSNASWANLRAYDFLYDFIFFIDLLFCTVGYVVSFRAIDTHLRSAEPTMLGWAVALVCYEPFWGKLFSRQYIQYNETGFGDWLSPFPKLRWAWAIVVLLLITIYVLATVAFGVRFSNLTHRGILTNGPYRFTKHPAYVSKNLSWWLTAVPFIGHDGWPNAVRRCILLVLWNIIYFLRAKTEERHLSRDPVYVEYALWMNEHGWLRFLRFIPGVRYVPPAGAVLPSSKDDAEARPAVTTDEGDAPAVGAHDPLRQGEP